MIEKIFLSIFFWEERENILFIKEYTFKNKPYVVVLFKNRLIIKLYPKKFFLGNTNFDFETETFFVSFKGNVSLDYKLYILSLIKSKEPFNFYLTDDEKLNTSLGIVFSITPKCNLKCKYCFNVYDYDLKERNFLSNLSFDELKNLFYNFRANGIQMIILSGGEPLLHPNIVSIVDYLYKKGFYIIINTNGTILNNNLLKELNKYPIHWMISIHEWTKESANKWVGISNLLDIKLKFISLIKNNFFLEILTILTADNISILENLYRFVYKKIIPDNWQFFRLFDVPGQKGTMIKDAQKAINKIYYLNSIYGVNNKIVDGIPYCVIKNLKKASKIIEGERHPSHLVKLTISPEGEVKYMCLFDEILDNILISKNIKKSLEHPLFKKLSNLEFLPKECQNCEYKRYCGGGSRFVAKLYSGNICGKDPLMVFR